MLGKIFIIVLVAALAFAGTWAADTYGVREPYSGLIVEFMGAAVVAVLTWALVSVPKRTRIFLDLKRNHVGLRTIWSRGARPSDDDVFDLKLLIRLQKGIGERLTDLTLIDAFKLYSASLDLLAGKYADYRNAAIDGENRNWSRAFEAPWNDTHKEFLKLAWNLSFFGALRTSLQKFTFNRANERNDPQPSPSLKAGDHQPSEPAS